MPSSVHAAENRLENDLLQISFNSQGEIGLDLDKEIDREVIVANEVGNRFQLYEDIPGKYDAWDIVATYADHEIDITGECVLRVDENGPIRASLLLEKVFLGSKITQRISLQAGSRQLSFETLVDWAERQKLLKVGFPVEISATHATYDIAYGNMQRPTHRNTSYDAAKFEVPAHKWMDVSQGEYGVSLLNNCKYGHEANGKTIRLSLLKGSVFPDEFADLGRRDTASALYPHPASWEDAGTIQQALDLNHALLCQFNYDLSDHPSDQTSHSFVSCAAKNVTLEAVKQAEDGQGVIIRLVENHNKSGIITLDLDRPIQQAWTCDLMENNETEISPNDTQIKCTLAPYEIEALAASVFKLGSAGSSRRKRSALQKLSFFVKPCYNRGERRGCGLATPRPRSLSLSKAAAKICSIQTPESSNRPISQSHTPPPNPGAFYEPHHRMRPQLF